MSGLGSPCRLSAGLRGRARAALSHPEWLVLALGGSALAGWLLNVERLKAITPTVGSMKANTAVLLVLAGGSLWLLRTGRALRVARAAAGLVVLVGLLTLAEHVFGRGLGIDQLLFHDRSAAAGRPGANTMLALVLAATALPVLDVELRGWFRPAQALAGATGVLALFAFTAHIYQTPSFSGFGGPSRMALTTSVGLMLLAAAIMLARPRAGVMTLVTGRGPGGIMVRRLLPTILILLLVGRLLLEGRRAGWYGTEPGLTLHSLAAISAVGILIWSTARTAERTDAERRRSTEQRMLALQDATEVEARYRRLIELAPEGVVIVDAEGRIELVNRQTETLFGYRIHELLGEPVELLVPEAARGAHAAHRAGYAAEPNLRRMGPDRELTGRRRDGSEFPVEIGLSPIHSERGLRVMSLIRDVSEQKRMRDELRALNAELERRVEARTAELSAANEELGAFSYSVSHDLRSPLRAIDGFSRILLDEARPRLEPGEQRYLDLVRTNVRDMGELIDGLLEFSRLSRQPLTLELVDTERLARDALAALQAEQDERAVEVVVGPLPRVEADRVLLKQVLVNLLSNAYKYTRERDPARIEVGSREENGAPVIFVRDNGVGFDMRHADKLFGVFQRLHRAEDYEGSGIGLALAARIVRRHGGRIWADARPGEGACFSFTLEEGESDE